MTWLGPTLRMRDERHYGNRIARCFADRPDSLNAMLRDAVAASASGEALACGTDRVDYRTLEARVAGLAGGLAGLGVTRGARVAILQSNRIEFVISFLAIVRLGAIAVLLNIRERPPELAYVIQDSGASVIIHDAELAASIPTPRDVPQLKCRISIGPDPGAIPYERVAAGLVREAAPIGEEDVAAILYTSGTTGRPKGATLTHLSIVHAAMVYQQCMGLTSAERSIVSVPMSHVTGLTAAIAAMLRVAGTLVILPEFNADAFIALAAAERMTHTVMVPAMYNLCLRTQAFEAADLSAWRIGGYGGAPMPAVTIERLGQRLPGLRLMNAYGSTETTGPVVLMPPSASAAHASHVGRAVPGCQIRIMDDDGREVAVGETGEVWLRAANVVPGYWSNPAATTESFVGGYWRSGDLGRIDADGFLELLDRKKDMINRGGFKIYSVEVENVLAGHPAIIEAAVVARPCPVLGERVHAFVVARTEGVTLAGLRTYCASKLADYKIPDSFTQLDQALPRNANGKVLKRDLRPLVPAEPAPDLAQRKDPRA